MMRTTINLDDDVLAMARTVADTRKISLGKAISELARRGAAPRVQVTKKNGFSVFRVEGARPFGLEEVQATLDEDDQEYVKHFRKPESSDE